MDKNETADVYFENDTDIKKNYFYDQNIVTLKKYLDEEKLKEYDVLISLIIVHITY